MNPGYNAHGEHPWEDIFVAMPDGTYICGPCLPDDVDPADQDVNVWAFWSDGWLGTVVCDTCKLSIPVYVNGEENGRKEDLGGRATDVAVQHDAIG